MFRNSGSDACQTAENGGACSMDFDIMIRCSFKAQNTLIPVLNLPNGKDE